MSDIARDTLFQFLNAEVEILAAAQEVLFLRAQACPELSLLADKKIVCEQTFKPDFDLLRKRGIEVITEVNGKFDLCLGLGSKQRDENFIQFAAGIDALREGGVFLSCLPKELGAARFEEKLHEVGGEPLSYIKNHCRVFGVKRAGLLDEKLLNEWRALRTLRYVPNTNLLSRPGIFGWDKIDKGSELLVKNLPQLVGRVADFGSGYGFLSQHILETSPQLTELHLFEAEKIALDASQESFKSTAHISKLHFHWQDVTTGLPRSKFDAIVTNPPFHSGKQMLIALGEKFISAAAESLKSGGEFYLVANSTLPYERTLAKKFRSFTQLASERGFKIIKAIA